MARSTDTGISSPHLEHAPTFTTGSPSKVYHRIAEVRRQQGLSLRTISRRTGLEAKELRRQEVASEDLRISELQRWQQAMEVPLGELLSESGDPLSPTVRDRAQLVKIMKTVVALSEVVPNTRAERMVEMLREQLLGLMPELAEIVGWPSFGSRRPVEHMGKISELPISVRSLSLDSNDDG
jgi:transcriptional regulator with XRE-family HTH domain